jgi:hypothetical protein
VSTDLEVYRVWFEDPAGDRRCIDVPRFQGIATVREGLWVNADWHYTVGSDAIHWIPPSRIVIASKLDKLEGFTLG